MIIGNGTNRKIANITVHNYVILKHKTVLRYF